MMKYAKHNVQLCNVFGEIVYYVLNHRLICLDAIHYLCDIRAQYVCFRTDYDSNLTIKHFIQVMFVLSF